MIRSNFFDQQLRQLDACRELVEVFRRNDGQLMDPILLGSTAPFQEQITSFWDESIHALFYDLPRFQVAARAGNEVGAVGAKIVQLKGGVILASCQFQMIGTLGTWFTLGLLGQEPQLVESFHEQWLTVSSAINEGVSAESFRLKIDIEPLTVHQDKIRRLIEIVFAGERSKKAGPNRTAMMVERCARPADVSATNLVRGYGAAIKCITELHELLPDAEAPRRHAILHNAKGTCVQLQALLQYSTGILEVLRRARPLAQAMGAAYSDFAQELALFVATSESVAPNRP